MTNLRKLKAHRIIKGIHGVSFLMDDNEDIIVAVPPLLDAHCAAQRGHPHAGAGIDFVETEDESVVLYHGTATSNQQRFLMEIPFALFKQLCHEAGINPYQGVRNG